MMDPHPAHPATIGHHIRWTTEYLAEAFGRLDDCHLHVAVTPREWTTSRTSTIEIATGFAVPTGPNAEQPDELLGEPHFWYSPPVIALTTTLAGLTWSPDRNARHIVMDPERDITYADNYVRLVADLLIGSVIAATTHPGTDRAAWLRYAEADLDTRTSGAGDLLSLVQVSALDRYLSPKDPT